MRVPRAWFNETITVAKLSSRNAKGDPTYGAQTTRKVRVERATKTIRTVEGTFTETETEVIGDGPDGEFDVTDRVWLPGANTADANASKVPVNVDLQKDKHGSAVIARAWF